MTTVHAAAGASVVEQFPPVPGNVPPLKVSGVVKPAPLKPVAVMPPVLFNVSDLSFDEPFATAPKSYDGPFETVMSAGATPVPITPRVAA